MLNYRSGIIRLDGLKVGEKYFKPYKKQYIYNLLTRKYEVREYSEYKIKDIKIRFKSVINNIDKTIPVIERILCSKNRFIMSKEWCKYLKIYE